MLGNGHGSNGNGQDELQAIKSLRPRAADGTKDDEDAKRGGLLRGECASSDYS
jgi:hypothetical protein